MTRRRNGRRELFPYEYVKDFNALAAAERAGYASGRGSADRLMKDPNIQAKIAELMKERNTALKVDAHRVLAELLKLADTGLSRFVRVDDGDFSFDASQATQDEIDALASITIGPSGTRVQTVDKGKLWALIGKHVDVAAFEDRMSVEVNAAQEVVKRLQNARQRAREE